MAVLRALVVDDEPLVRERVRDLLAKATDVTVVGECEDGLAALEALRTLAPDLVFLDVQMPGLSGLDVLEAHAQVGPLPLVVFVTAYSEYAVEAFRAHAVDYLLKPIEAARFAEALDRARQEHLGRSRRTLESQLASLLAEAGARSGPRAYLPVRDGDRHVLVRTRDVLCVEATGNYVTLHQARESLLWRSTLSALEARLDARQFARTHRSWMVNLDEVREVKPAVRGFFQLTTSGGHVVPISEQHRDVLDRLLGAERG